MLPIEIENIILKKKAQLDYVDVMNEFKYLIQSFRNIGINFVINDENRGPLNNILIRDTYFYSNRDIIIISCLINDLKSTPKCYLCRHNINDGIKRHLLWNLCRYCYFGLCNCRTECKYSSKNCDICPTKGLEIFRWMGLGNIINKNKLLIN